MTLRACLIAFLMLLPGWAFAAELDPFGFSEEDYSSWRIIDAPYPYDPAALGEPNNYGCFPVGNGQVFAYLGVDGDFNTLRGITGPGDGVGYYGEIEDSTAEVQFEDGRYLIHWKIPWESLPYLGYEPGRLVGFTCFLSDYDEGLSELMYLTDWGAGGGIEWRFWDCGLLYFE